jgi:hypothetical protein
VARARLLSASLGSSEKFHELMVRHKRIGEFAQVLFCLIIPNTDDYGRCEAGAFTVKHRIFPSCARLEKDFQAALSALDDVDLIHIYESGGKLFIQVVNFEQHQSSTLHKRTKSRYPDPPDRKAREVPGNSGKPPETPPQSNLTSRESNQDPYGGGKPPVPGNEQHWVWTEGVRLLTNAGSQEQHARSLLGKLCQQYGKGAVAAGILETSVANTVDPKAYLVGVLKQNGNRRETAGERNARNIAETFRYLGVETESGRPTDSEMPAGVLASGTHEG